MSNNIDKLIHKTRLIFFFWYGVQLAFILCMLTMFTGCGKLDVNTKPVKVEHELTIDIDAFKEFCNNYSSTPNDCMNDLITQFNQSQGS